MEKLILIDGNSLLFRAYFAMRPMITSKGVHTQGVFAFINMLSKIIGDNSPDYIAVAFDMKAKTFRHEKYPEYKAGRQQTPIELLSEIPILHKVLRAMNIAVLELPRYEADDIIGTLSASATRRGLHTLIISGDKDELQLVDENVNVLINRKGMSEFDLYDVNAMKERYNLTPSQFVDLKALMGDKSDNIPGVPGIGEKKGIALIEKYGSLEAVIEHADEVSGKVGESLREGVEIARLSKWLATINVEAPVEYDWEELRFQEPDINALLEIYTELEFNSFIKKLKTRSQEVVTLTRGGTGNFGNPGTGDSPRSSQAGSDVDAIADEFNAIRRVSLEEFISAVPGGSEVYIEAATDASHLDRPEIRSIHLYSRDESMFASSVITPMNEELIASSIANMGYKLCGTSLKRIVYSLLSVLGSGNSYDNGIQPYYDAEVAEYLLSPNSSKYSLEKMLLRHCEYITEEDETAYVGEKMGEDSLSIGEEGLLRRAFYSAKVREAQEAKLGELGLDGLYHRVEMPLVLTLAKMELEGIRCDSNILESIGNELSEKIGELESKIYDLAGRKFNINSPKQLGPLLFDELGIPYPNPLSASGSYSTAHDVLAKLSDEYEIVRLILDYRKVAKLKSTYVEGLGSTIARDGKIHPRFMQTVTATGRLSCTEPNLQNIPIRDEYGRLIRKAFVTSTDDSIFTGSDYSQIELRILAALSGDESMIEDFRQGKDIHRATAARVFDIPEGEVSSLDRTKAKAVNFGVVYGMSGFGLGESLSISRAEGQRYINEYFGKHPAIKAYLDSCVREGEQNRQVRTYFGRIRQIPEFASRKFTDRELAKRLAMNTPIQGTAADIIKIAMNSVTEALSANNLRSRLILQIHDELIIEGPKSEADEVYRILNDYMSGAAKLAVDLVCDIHSGSTWYELK